MKKSVSVVEDRLETNKCSLNTHMNFLLLYTFLANTNKYIIKLSKTIRS